MIQKSVLNYCCCYGEQIFFIETYKKKSILLELLFFHVKYIYCIIWHSFSTFSFVSCAVRVKYDKYRCFWSVFDGMKFLISRCRFGFPVSSLFVMVLCSFLATINVIDHLNLCLKKYRKINSTIKDDILWSDWCKRLKTE